MKKFLTWLRSIFAEHDVSDPVAEFYMLDALNA